MQRSIYGPLTLLRLYENLQENYFIEEISIGIGQNLHGMMAKLSEFKTSEIQMNYFNMNNLNSISIVYMLSTVVLIIYNII